MRQIGPYQILEELGRGAMGVVYRAVDPSIDRPLAIKIIRAHEFDSAEEVTEAGMRLTREASVVGRLSHPNIVALYQFGKEPDFDYIAMEFVPGASLDKLLKSGRRFQPSEVVDIVRQVAAALDHAHQSGVVHRDIKPANIIARPDGAVKVTDFGIARISSQTITRDGASMGTPAYMAPEQIKGLKADARADQFSLAIVAYQLFSGKLPFNAPSDMALMLQIVNNEPAPLRDPSKADRIIRRALAKDPARRFASCGEFAAALDAAFPAYETFDPEATVRSLPGVPNLPSAPGKKSYRGALAGVLIACCCAAALAIFFVPPAPKPEPTVRNRVVAGTATEIREPVINPIDRQRYVWIPAGSFMMGCSQGDSGCETYPPTAATIEHGFWLGQTEVTQAAWRRVEHTNPSEFKGDRLPVESVSWNDANEYCRSIGGRLPTDAEWEYAAHGGSPPIRDQNLGSVAWYRENSGNSTHPVAGKRPNSWRLYDMLGNVSEWVNGISGGSVKGGSYGNEPQYVRADSQRVAAEEGFKGSALGFRCAADEASLH